MAAADAAAAAGPGAAAAVPDPAALQRVIEKSVVMGMGVTSKGASGPLADLLAHYAGLLVAQVRAWCCMCSNQGH